MVQARRNAKEKEERYDLFSSLLDANEDELDNEAKLSDSALIGVCQFCSRHLSGSDCSQGTSSSSWSLDMRCAGLDKGVKIRD